MGTPGILRAVKNCWSCFAANNEYEVPSDRLSKPQNPCMVLEQLEPRLLLSADLAITNPVAPVSATILDAIEVSWTVENQGADATSSPMWTDRVYISDDPIKDDDDTSLIYRDVLDE